MARAAAIGEPTSPIPTPRRPTASASRTSPRSCRSCRRTTRTGSWAAPSSNGSAGPRLSATASEKKGGCRIAVSHANPACRGSRTYWVVEVGYAQLRLRERAARSFNRNRLGEGFLRLRSGTPHPIRTFRRFGVALSRHKRVHGVFDALWGEGAINAKSADDAQFNLSESESERATGRRLS